ncbi:GNAT family N-acetyltransferase [Leptospira ilyithenensis]|uniref:GNAT family N-acetyltransferase n=1 Tax=Leptospira ilyithenensis TaxID=2484901 RepID=A0A4R9LTW0_9LEPT|nr:GNAT family N-acetyltransferase [Leptospira ilyithenensis]TGN14133.1 GNAT family N-acetyltransferase [Leptospira ilyithenensis]
MSHGIRVLSEEDLPLLSDLEKQCFPGEEWTSKMLASHLEYHQAFVWEENSVVSYALVCETPWEVEIFRIATLPTYQRKGAAFKFLESILKRFATKDFFLEVKESNLPALFLYEKSGFSILEKRKNYYPDGSTAIIMLRKKEL